MQYLNESMRLISRLHLLISRECCKLCENTPKYRGSLRTRAVRIKCRFDPRIRILQWTLYDQWNKRYAPAPYALSHLSLDWSIICSTKSNRSLNQPWKSWNLLDCFWFLQCFELDFLSSLPVGIP